MTKAKFKEIVATMVEDFGVVSYLDNITDDMTQEEIDDDLWVNCPICGEPILFEDIDNEWEDYINHSVCPICEENWYD